MDTITIKEYDGMNGTKYLSFEIERDDGFTEFVYEEIEGDNKNVQKTIL